MNEAFSRFRCWTSARVQESVFGDIAQLGLDADAVFLAAHTSLDIRRIKGAYVETSTPEQSVLRSLTSSFGQPFVNTLIAVTGPSGSGKSHLVRWLRAHLSDADPRYHLIYVPRELATLRELIGRVLDGMPPSAEAEAVRDELDKAVARKSPNQLAEELLDRLRSVISYELPDTLASDTNAFRGALLGTRASDDRTSGRRNGLADLLLLAALREHLLRPEGSIRGMVDFLRGQRSGRDEKAPEFIPDDVALRQNAPHHVDDAIRTAWKVAQYAPETACALLNEALPRAVAETLGMRPGSSLGDVFRKARVQLHERGKELVLLFEDLAQFGLFDGELFDQFVLQPGSTLAPIRVVFAITDGRFATNVPDTVQTRLTHRFEIAGISGAGEDAALTPLLARYLNVARVGRERLVEAWESADAGNRESGKWVPNACWGSHGGGECPHRETCWPSFGTSAEFGLYPYNPTAIRRAVAGHRGGPITPRVVVDSFVRDFLLEADIEIVEEVFPSDRVRQRFDFSVARSKESIVPPSSLSEEERDRLHRARVIWADGAVEAPGITEAFSLPTGSGPSPEPPPPPPPATPPSDAPHPQPLTPLFDWENGGTLPNRDAVFYREALYALTVRRLDLNSLLIDIRLAPAAQLLNRLVTPNSFEFTSGAPGRPAGRAQLEFPLSPTGKEVRLLSAVRWFWDHGHWDTKDPSRKWDFVGDADEAHLDLDEFLDECAHQIEAAVLACLHRGPIDPAAAAIALRAVALRALGHTLPDGPQALDFVLSEGRHPAPAPSPQWAPVSAAAEQALARIDRSWVAAFATARQGDTGDPQAVDTARLMPALDAVRADPSPLLASSARFDVAFNALQEKCDLLGDALRRAAAEEVQSLQGIVAAVAERIAGLDLLEALKEIESAGRVAADNRVFRPQNRYEMFRSACERLKELAADEVRAWQELGQEMADGARAQIAALAAQSWAGRARAACRDLDVIVECLQATSAEVDDYLIQEFGETPQQVEAEIRKKLAALNDLLASQGDQP